MGGCEPGHEWRPERETGSFVSFRCAGCGSVCVAPKPLDGLGLEVRRPARPRRAPTAPRRRPDVPSWAPVATSSSSTAG
jgi:hypothetical protein